MWSMFDSFINLITGLGTMKDPTTATQYLFRELNRNELEMAYRGNWIAKKVVNAPAEDATAMWRDWQASKEEIEQIETVEKTFMVQKKMRQAISRARLYGGAALVLGVDDGNDINEAIDLDSVGVDDLKWIVVMNRYELSAGPRIYDVDSEWFTRPEYYTVSTPTVGLEGNKIIQGMAQMHPSRVIEFTGAELPDWRLQSLGGSWGDSVIQAMDDTLKSWGLTLGGITNMINDAKMDVVKIPNFSTNIVKQEYKDNLLKRFAAANAAKSTVNTLIMDEKETWERIQSNFAGLPQILMALMPIVSAAGGIPVSRLMGQAPGKGLSQATSGGESDLYNYYDGIMATQKTEYSPQMTALDQCIIRSALGKYDPGIYYNWTPLYKPEPKDVSAMRLQRAQTTQIYVNLGLINEDALRQAVVNQMIEDGDYAGLDDAIDEHGMEPPEPTPEEMAQHQLLLSKAAVAGAKPPAVGGPAKPKQLPKPGAAN